MLQPFGSYKPPTPGGFSLNSVTSFNVDNVALKNEERLRRLEAIRKDGKYGAFILDYSGVGKHLRIIQNFSISIFLLNCFSTSCEVSTVLYVSSQMAQE